MRSIFVPYSGSEVEERLTHSSESTFRHEAATDAERRDVGFEQIWLYTMRHYPLMPPDPKRDDELLAKSSRVIADKKAIYEMAEPARRLGYRPGNLTVSGMSNDSSIPWSAELLIVSLLRLLTSPKLFMKFSRTAP
ncbi:hypothetical protein KXV98_004440 [Aspergillus fumigatus]|nr:hypothetical protein KXV98_004440 [Aspergillus fumigatus]